MSGRRPPDPLNKMIVFGAQRILRDHMTDLWLIFNMLGEPPTTGIARNKDAQGLPENKQAAQEGGSVAGNARRQLEAKSGRAESIIFS